MRLFDSFVQALSLTCIDAPDMQASIFPAGQIAKVPLSSAVAQRFGSLGQAVSPARRSCACSMVSLKHTNPEMLSKTPTWMFTPGWRRGWSLAEIRLEENRRMVWHAIQGFTGHMTRRAEQGLPFTPFFLTDPLNVSLLASKEREDFLPFV